MISVKTKGDNDKTTLFLKKAKNTDPTRILESYGEMGLEALRNATPKRTGLTSESWYYEVTNDRDSYYLSFYNSNIQNGIRIAIIVDVGHGTGSGGYVKGRNYIDPAIRPIFDQIANAAWREVTDA